MSWRVLLQAAVAGHFAAAAAGAACRVTYPDTGFTHAPWGDLSKSVEVRDVFAGLHTDEPGGTAYTGMMGSTQLPGWARANSTAAKYVALQDAKEASAALKFAAAHNLQVSVKSTGHDFSGRSSRPGSLLVWTHELNNISWHDDFRPAGCVQSEGRAVTLGGGVQFRQIYREAMQRDRFVIGGTCTTVGHVGFTLGGGYGIYSRMYGSGATNLLEAEVVLADGRVVTASTCGEQADLFRSLRGGGGAFGVVTKATYRTYPFPSGMHGRARGVLQGNMHVGLASFLTWYADIVRHGLAQHFGGVVLLGGRWGIKGKVSVQLHYVGINESQCSELFSELGEVSCKAAAQTWPPAHTDAGELPDGIYHNGTAMRYFTLEDIESTSFAARAVRLADASSNGLTLSLNYVLGQGSDIALASASETAVHPQVYEAIGVLKIELIELHVTPTSAMSADAEAVASFSMLRSELDALLPGAGSYYNEGDYTDVAFQNRYWGSNYPELLATKRKYDPDNVFTCHQCVGSEHSCARRLSARHAEPLLI
eukprot:CAMPEP_0177200462 /NCGR_PEP_ID=MMETSP0367-20130122/26234_1 /TAXON_ID=447022 ORGANISM="Scrippsiella hangoei-like, Strain SHHI-4" /NCGR_SAMPLE_ID=MMETSP0367 /ASSEMBLY_ACC=CAM_ASM_000362 /LENGTH=536 /DNA_ID=CAMNT_0018648907 /DNA_START=50 /DNA_END=1660 /DNA_ORIENTATION=-